MADRDVSELFRFPKEVLDTLEKQKTDIADLKEINKLLAKLGLPTQTLDQDLEVAERTIDLIRKRAIPEEE